MKITKIAITGGPGGGKSSSLRFIEEEIEKLGYEVIPVPETATKLFSNGINYESCGSVLAFQREVLRTQLKAEEEAEKKALQLAEEKKAEKILILCDRGVMDGKAYLSDEEFCFLASELEMNKIELRDRYDAVFHMESAAKHFPDKYSTANNSVRLEGAKEAAKIDDNTIAVWVGHPHMRLIPAFADVGEKRKLLLKEIKSFLGDPFPLEIEKKFLIEYPDTNLLRSLSNCGVSEIEQVYLTKEDGENRRIRKRGLDGNYTYFYTRKKKIDGMKRIEIEEKISAERYEELKKNADPGRKPIIKDRYCLLENGIYYEIDVYSFWKDKATMEIELRTEDQTYTFPKEINVISDVTLDPRFTNAELAKNHEI